MVFNYKMLMKNKNIDFNELSYKIIEKYNKLDLKKFIIETEFIENDSSDTNYKYKDIRNQILEINPDIYYVVDVLVEYLYNYKKSNYKTTLWSSFGDIIVENLKNNIPEDTICCEYCGKRVSKNTNIKNTSQKYCSQECFDNSRREYNAKKQKEYRKNKVVNNN